MPQAPDELRKLWSCETALALVKRVGHFRIGQDFVISPLVPGYRPNKEQQSAIDYLCFEWDYGYSPYPVPAATDPDNVRLSATTFGGEVAGFTLDKPKDYMEALAILGRLANKFPRCIVGNTKVPQFFHACWGEASSLPDYVKQDWLDMQRKLTSLGVVV